MFSKLSPPDKCRKKALKLQKLFSPPFAYPHDTRAGSFSPALVTLSLPTSFPFTKYSLLFICLSKTTDIPEAATAVTTTHQALLYADFATTRLVGVKKCFAVLVPYFTMI